MNKLLKVAALTLVLVLGSLGQMVGASAGNRPGSFSYPAEMAIRKMSLTMTADEVTESKLQMGLAQGQVNEVQEPAGNGRDDACPGDCDLTRDQDRDRDCTCDGDCDLTRDQDRDRDCACDSGCDLARDQDRDREGGHSGGPGGGGHH